MQSTSHKEIERACETYQHIALAILPQKQAPEVPQKHTNTA